jgi:predicted phosphodiesterase
VSSIRLLHLSDLHLADTRRLLGPDFVKYFTSPLISRPGNAEAAKVVAVTAYEYKEEIDSIIVTGDLANTGWRSDLLKARAFVGDPRVEEPAPRVDSLGPIGKLVHLIPGNHDRYRMPLPTAGGVAFDDVFDREWSKRDVECPWGPGWEKGMARQGVKRVRLATDPPITALMADFTLRHQDLTIRAPRTWQEAYGNGRVNRAMAVKLGELTEAANRDGDHVIWISHFAPWFKGLDSLLRLLDEDELLAAARAGNVSHILCGHTHVPRRYRQGDLEILCAGSCTKDEKTSERFFPCSFLMLELESADDRLVTKTCRHFEWSNAELDFIDRGDLPVWEEPHPGI